MPSLSLKYTPGTYKKMKVSHSKDLFNVFVDIYNEDTIEYREECLVVYMNGANNTIGFSKHTTGSTCSSVIDPKIILTEALLCGANSIALSHNHPSCQLDPSIEDENITKKVKQACEVIGIRFLDHLIIAGDKSGYYSFCDEGKI